MKNKIFAVCMLLALSFAIEGCGGVRVRNTSRRGILQGGDQASNMVISRSPATSELGFAWPLKSGSVSSYFGLRKRKFHDGIDIRSPKGTEVFAAKDGVVIYSARRIKGYGNMVVLKHTDGTASVYAHHSKNLVIKGQMIKQGQVIAKVGSTGHSTGPHLHFEIRRGEDPVDPLLYLPTMTYAHHASN